jgi:RNA polymerase sigma-32 factor
VTSHLRLVVKIAKGYRGYGLPISDVISEGNVGLMQALERFEPEKGFRLATYAAWWIRASIQEYILRSWSLVKIGTATNQKKLFFNLRRAKSRISVLDEGDMRPDQVKLLAKRLGVTEHNVIDMNRRLGGDASLNAPIREDGDAGERQDWLIDDSPSQEGILIKNEELENRRQALRQALSSLNVRERRIFEARRLAEDRSRWECSRTNSASRASGCARSRCLPSRKCKKPFSIGLSQLSGLNAGITDQQFHMGLRAPREQTQGMERE